MRHAKLVMLGLAAIAPVHAAAGTVPHRDVEVGVQGGRIVTGLIDLDTPGNPVTTGVRVFGGAFGEAPDLTDDPGFNARGGTVGAPTPFAPGTLIAFDIVDSLRLWDGADFDQTAPSTLTVFLGFNPDITTPAIPDSVVGGFNFVAAASNGGFHQHFVYFLDEPASEGVYRLALRLRASGGVVQPSETFWIVFRQGDSPAQIEAQSAAIAYMNDLLAPPGACPGDADGDGAVNFDDITSILSHWLTPGPLGDANHDGAVNFDDITEVLVRWLEACP
ncbi:MAG TPA: hypothetical protein DEB06_08505 [Phycisphaerales bacterium]|nr:hypothetical protein [Phycisphaerales bacterium]